jgi:hypothetical protein
MVIIARPQDQRQIGAGARRRLSLDSPIKSILYV